MTSGGPVKQFRSFDGSPHPAPSQGARSYFCTNCGQPMPGLNRYCTHCGTYLADPLDHGAGGQAGYSPMTAAPAAGAKRHRMIWMGILAGVALLGAAVLVGLNLWDAPHNQESWQGEPTAAAATQSGQGTSLWAGALPSASDTHPAPATQARPEMATSTGLPAACPGAPEQRLESGEDARVCTQSDNVFLRSGPGRDYSVLERVATGTVLTVTGGPRCADGWSFWEVELPDGASGWMSEGGDDIDPYFLCPN
jgi:hypothetical protein